MTVSAEVRVHRAAHRQRVVEGVAVVGFLLLNLLFQLGNRATVQSAKQDGFRTDSQLLRRLDTQEQTMAVESARIGQLEQALRAAGVPVPDTTTTTTSAPPVAPGVAPAPRTGATSTPGTAPSTSTPGTAPTTTTTSPPPPPPPPTTRPCLPVPVQVCINGKARL